MDIGASWGLVGFPETAFLKDLCRPQIGGDSESQTSAKMSQRKRQDGPRWGQVGHKMPLKITNTKFPSRFFWQLFCIDFYRVWLRKSTSKKLKIVEFYLEKYISAPWAVFYISSIWVPFFVQLGSILASEIFDFS